MAKKLYVGNLPWTVTEDELRALFAQHGEIVSAQIITDRESGRSRGFGFVEMENADEALSVLNGKDFNGRALTVNEARERQPRTSGGGGYGGGGNRGGNRGGGYGNRNNY